MEADRNADWTCHNMPDILAHDSLAEKRLRMFVIRRQTPLHPNTAAAAAPPSPLAYFVAVGPFPPSMLAILPFLSIFRWN